MAHVQLLNRNSKPINVIVSDSLGNFLFNNVTSGNYILKVEAISYGALPETINVVKNKNWFDTLFMQPVYSELESVVVSAKRPAVVIKNDTTEFTASVFKTQSNATVEDVFKKIPGVEVSRNGTIKAQGEMITQIYVDGKPFFGNDVKAVMQNFSADMIDKIQIIDKKTDQALETKADDGSVERIINITLKKNNKKGVFGKEYVAYGSDNRYEAKANANLFDNDKKFSVIAGMNNTGRYDGSSYNANGITENKQIKTSYANKLNNNFDFSTWMAYDENKLNIRQLLNRQNIFSDSSTYYVANNQISNHIKTLYGGLYFEYRPDSVSIIRFNESLCYTNNNAHSTSAFTTTTFDMNKINEGVDENNGSFKTPSLKGQISYNRRLSNSGRNFFVGFSNFYNINTLTLYNNFNNYFYPSDSDSYSTRQKQLQFSNNRNTNIGTTVSYTEPVTPHQTINFSYVYNADMNNNPREVYDYDEQTQLYNFWNDSLSNYFINSTKSNAVSVNYNYTSPKIGFSAGLRWKQSITENFSAGKQERFQQTFKGLLPNFSFYSAGKNKRLNIYYSSFIQSPQPYQLQPVVDNTNPLYLSLGNATLKYAEVHTLKYNFKYFSSKNERGFNSSASFSTISDNISTSVTYDNSTGKQIAQPINTNGAFNWNIWLSYFQPLKICNEKIGWSINFSNGRSKTNNLLNGETNRYSNNFTRIFMGLTYDSHDWLNVHTDISFTKQTNQYSLQALMDNIAYYVTVSPVVTVRVGKNTEINVDDDYRRSMAKTINFNSCVHILNFNFTQYFSSKKNTWVTLKAFNVLDEAATVSQQYGDNFIQNTQVNNLSRYFLLAANFRLNKIQK